MPVPEIRLHFQSVEDLKEYVKSVIEPVAEGYGLEVVLKKKEKKQEEEELVRLVRP
jgi:hypothetical protein